MFPCVWKQLDKTELKQLVSILRKSGSRYAPLLLYPNVLKQLSDSCIETVSRGAYAWAPVVATALTIRRNQQRFENCAKVCIFFHTDV